jgi:hypothetical protein
MVTLPTGSELLGEGRLHGTGPAYVVLRFRARLAAGQPATSLWLNVTPNRTRTSHVDAGSICIATLISLCTLRLMICGACAGELAAAAIAAAGIVRGNVWAIAAARSKLELDLATTCSIGSAEVFMPLRPSRQSCDGGASGRLWIGGGCRGCCSLASLGRRSRGEKTEREQKTEKRARVILGDARFRGRAPFENPPQR